MTIKDWVYIVVAVTVIAVLYCVGYGTLEDSIDSTIYGGPL